MYRHFSKQNAHKNNDRHYSGNIDIILIYLFSLTDLVDKTFSFIQADRSSGKDSDFI